MLETMVDLHVHPSLKPYGRSFDEQSWGANNANRKKKNSIWNYDPPNFFDKAIRLITGVAKFTQTDCTTLIYGNVRVVCAALYPTEKAFFANELGTGKLSDLAVNFISGVGKQRVDYIQGIKNYFEDLVREYEYYKQLNNADVTTDAGVCRYLLAKNFSEIEQHLQDDQADINTLFIVLTIEGLHSLNTDYNEKTQPDVNILLENLQQVKQWEHPPFFVTLNHHFYNHLSGHAESLSGIAGKASDQRYGMNEGITEMGKTVIRETLSTQNGKRIYIDVKHMSALSRKQYMAMLTDEFAGEKIPFIISHGACNGLRSFDEPVADGKNTSHKLLAGDINFYDNEILLAVKTGGIIGLQLDERRIASATTKKNTKHSPFLNKIRHYRAELLWNQVQHIAELLDRHEMFAWDHIAIGSDYDGIINPLNGYLTVETFSHLQSYVERYAHNYMSDKTSGTLKPYNRISASEIVDRIFSTNGLEFMRRWFV